VSALIGFGVHSLLPAAYEVESKGMVGSVVGLVGSLLSLVLSLLIWTTHGLFSTQQMQLQTLGRKILELDFALAAYGSETASRRALLREHVKRIQARLWADGVEARRFILHGKLPEDLLALCRGLVESVPEDMLRRPGGFGPAQSAPADSMPTARLMAYLGRSVDGQG